MLGQGDVLQCCRLGEEGSYLVGREAGDATAYTGDEELLVGMLLGIGDEFIDIGADSVNASLHCGDGITLTLNAIAIAHYGTKIKMGDAGGTASVHTGKVAAEDKHLVGFETLDKVGSHATFFVDCFHIVFYNG